MEQVVGQTKDVGFQIGLVDRVRLTWRPPGWDHDTTVQVAVTGAGEGRPSVRVHQEWLADEGERERQRAHWRAVMDKVEEALG